MPRAEAASPPIVGRRSKEMDHLIRTMRETTPVASRIVSKGGRGRPSRSGGRAALSGGWELGRVVDLKDFVLVNALEEGKRMNRAEVTALVRAARAQEPGRIVVVVLDEENEEAVGAARDAGAAEFLGRDEIENPEAVSWRLRNAALLSRATAVLEESGSADSPERRPLTVRNARRASARAIREAEKAIDEAVATLPTAAERRATRQDFLQIIAPGLRNADSGRLDARRIADATGLSLAALARASGISQQALSATPDSPGAQRGLLPIARLSELLDEVFTPEEKRVWLRTPNDRFDGRTPLQAIEAGDAELVALSVESALEGHPD